MEFLGLVISFREACSEVIASLPLSKARTDKLVKLAQKLRAEGAASVARLRNLAGNLGFAQSAVM